MWIRGGAGGMQGKLIRSIFPEELLEAISKRFLVREVSRYWGRNLNTY